MTAAARANARRSVTMERSLFGAWTPVEVRWADMDAFAHVNNATYFIYLECARIRFFESLGLAELMGHDRVGVGLVSVNCNFRRQVRYPATLEVGTRVTKIGRRSFHLQHALFLAGEETPVADGVSVGVWVDYRQEKAIDLPASLRAGFERHLAP
jgi:acyl-CoA thioester hydrolase